MKVLEKILIGIYGLFSMIWKMSVNIHFCFRLNLQKFQFQFKIYGFSKVFVGNICLHRLKKLTEFNTENVTIFGDIIKKKIYDFSKNFMENFSSFKIY